MADDLGRAELELTTDQSRLNAGLDQAERKTKGWLGKVTAGFKGASTSVLQGIGQGIGQGAFGLVQAGLEGVVRGAMASVDAASDLNETLAKSQVVFGDHADEMEAWGAGAADSMGLSKNAAIGAAAGFGDLFNKMDETRGKSREMSMDLVGLASDLASFNNLDPTETLEKLRAGLAGEAEPLRRVGVYLNEAKVAAKAAELGFVPLNGKLTDGAKIAARYALIMEETASAQGDFARTSDGLANQQRRLNGQLENFMAIAGQALIPVLSDIADTLLDIAPRMLDFATAVGPHLTNGVNLALAPLKALIDLVSGVGFWAAKALEPLSNLADFLGDTVDNITGETERAAAEATARARETFNTGMAGIADAGGAAKSDMKAAAEEAFEPIPEVARRKGNQANTIIRNSLQMMVDSVKAGRQDILDAATGAADAIFDPVIAQTELKLVQLELGSKELREQLRSTDREERAQAEIRKTQLLKEQIELNTILTTYGTKAQQIARTSALLTTTNWTEMLRNATPEQEAAINLWRESLERQLRTLEGDASAGGRRAGQSYATSLTGTEKDVRTSVSGVTGVVKSAFDLAGKAFIWGDSTGDAYRRGLVSALWAAWTPVHNAINAITSIFKAGSPPGPDSPLHLIDVWGERTGDAWTDNLAAAIGRAPERIRPKLGRLSERLSAYMAMPRLEPALAGGGAHRAAAGVLAAMDAHGGRPTQTIEQHSHYHMHAEGAIPIRTATDVVREMRRMGELREMPERTVPMIPLVEAEHR